MGLASNVKEISLANPVFVSRAPQIYLSATGNYVLFNIIGGAIEILNLSFQSTAAPVGAVTVRCTAGGINLDAGAVDIGTAGVIGGIWWSGLNVAATGTSALAAPRTVNTATTFICGTSTATIACTFAAGTSLTGRWGLIYRRLSPRTTVRPA
jgi:hypothetical protein